MMPTVAAYFIPYCPHPHTLFSVQPFQPGLPYALATPLCCLWPLQHPVLFPRHSALDQGSVDLNRLDVFNDVFEGISVLFYIFRGHTAILSR
jgi:hypothetical protein